MKSTALRRGPGHEVRQAVGASVATVVFALVTHRPQHDFVAHGLE